MMRKKRDNSLLDKKLREKIFLLNLSKNLKEFANYIGIPEKTIYNWSSEKYGCSPTIEHLEIIANKLNIDITWLIADKTTSLQTLLIAYFRHENPTDRNAYRIAREIAKYAIYTRDSAEAEKLCRALAAWWQQATASGHVELAAAEPAPADISAAIERGQKMPCAPDILADIRQRIDRARAEYVREELPAFPDATMPRVITMTDINAIPILGYAAADDAQRSKASIRQEAIGKLYPPQTIWAAEILGDSMEPIILRGQYALCREPTDTPPDGGIVIAGVMERDGRVFAHSEDEREFYCKRIQRCGDRYYFFSQSPCGTPVFSSLCRYCVIWPVIGVWFGGRGRPPVLND